MALGGKFLVTLGLLAIAFTGYQALTCERGALALAPAPPCDGIGTGAAERATTVPPRPPPCLQTGKTCAWRSRSSSPCR